MSRPIGSTKTPTYRFHKCSNQAVVTIDARDYYLGDYKSKASKAEYDRLIGEWLAGGRHLSAQANADLTLAEIIDRFWDHCATYYRKPDGTPSSEAGNFRDALRPLLRLYGSTSAAQFGPLALRSTRQEMIRLGWSRTYTNKNIGRVKSLFKWAVGLELVPANIYHALQAVEGLKAGRSEARETVPVRPVSDELLDAVIPHMAPPVRAMVELQRLTGMRPGEVCGMRKRDIELGAELWRYRPASHKTQHLGHERTVPLGQRYQMIIKPFLDQSEPDAYLFTPAAVMTWVRERRRAVRKTPLSCGNTSGTNRSKNARKRPGGRFKVEAYWQSVTRACDAAFSPPVELARQKVAGKKGKRWESPTEWQARLGPQTWAQLEAWHAAHRFHPHQIRHTAATRLRREFGLEAAQVILGHRTLTVTQVYAEKNIAAAENVMAKVG